LGADAFTSHHKSYKEVNIHISIAWFSLQNLMYTMAGLEPRIFVIEEDTMITTAHFQGQQF
jgi:hypothetical protein